MKRPHGRKHPPHETMRTGRLRPKIPGQWFKIGVEDSVMALIATQEPGRHYTAKMVKSAKKAEFDKTVKRLCELGCDKNVLFYCLSRREFVPVKAVPSADSVRELATRMEEIAEEISKMEGTGLLDPLDEEELSHSMDQIISAANAAWFRVLPNSLKRRAAMYRLWAERFAGQKLRKDLLSRVNRLSLSVYVKLATNTRGSTEPEERRRLVVQLLNCIGERAERSQLRRELEDFESLHFQAHDALQDKLQRMHDAADS